MSDVLKEKKAKKTFKGAVIGLFVLLGVAFAAIFGVSFAAGEAIKESHVNAEGVMTGLDGSAVKTEEVRSYAMLYDLPRIETNILARLDHQPQQGHARTPAPPETMGKNPTAIFQDTMCRDRCFGPSLFCVRRGRPHVGNR